MGLVLKLHLFHQNQNLFSVGYLFLILKFFARVSERKPLAEAIPNISASFLSSFKTGGLL